MPLFTLVPTLHQATMTPEWTSISQFKSKGREFTLQGVTYQVFNKKQKLYPLFVRIGVIIVTALLLGIILTSNTIRNIFFKGRETIRAAVPIDILQPIDPEIDSVTTLIADKHPTLVPLYREIDRIREEDRTSPTNSWKKGLGAGEREQTLEEFNITDYAILNGVRHTVNIFTLGNQSNQEKRIVDIVADYLHAVHGIAINVVNEPLELNPSRSRIKSGNLQYSTESQFETLNKLTDQYSFSLGFTNQDIHAADVPTVNFLYGQANHVIACGVFSSKRQANDGVNKTIVRLMNTASHEFAHVRGIKHCTENICAIQGSNNLKELDQSSLIFCSQDMAKISLVNNRSLQKSYQLQLAFFENFYEKYHVDIDFSKEIQLLKNKIHKLENKEL